MANRAELATTCGDAYVEAIYAYAKAHNIAVVRFQFEISDTYVFDRPQAGQM
jgi:hypothetical protein